MSMQQNNESKKQMTIGELLASQKKQIEAALPKHLSADRMLRVVMTEIRKKPKLAKCTATSLVSCVLDCSQLGLEPGGVRGLCYLIPYENRKAGVTECQFILGYKGMIELAYRSEKVSNISVHEVYSNDHFEVEYGINEKCVHKPFYFGAKKVAQDRGEFIGAYGVVRMKDGGYTWGYMPKEEIDAIRQRSKSKNDGPWVTDYDEMAKKTVIRRLFKYMPVSVEMQTAIAIDEASERGEQYNSIVIDGEFDSTQAEKNISKTDKLAETLNKSKPAITFENVQEKIIHCNSKFDLEAVNELIKQVKDKDDQEGLLAMCEIRENELKEAGAIK